MLNLRKAGNELEEDSEEQMYSWWSSWRDEITEVLEQSTCLCTGTVCSRALEGTEDVEFMGLGATSFNRSGFEP